MTKKIPFFLALLSMVGGVFISILFATQEDMFKKNITAGLEKNVKIQQIVDPKEKAEKIKAESTQCWRYYQRYHFHSTGIGAMMIGILLFLYRLKAPKNFITLTSYMIAIGGFLYPFVWLFAGIYGPEMGRSEAKEAFAIFGYMGGLFLVGGVFSMFLSLKYSLSES